ncbi:hypothetical protein swp_0444 [Shewanella piezotolerans WP3]|uniref:Uncharacterized protein n=1 Tax=Shewanella piezotolerans (strain WP3 / JCM 13877) TaxID=225849 RepID=B8CI00_SHEPW|nr:hypothetical protein swp_0444 [Shewanella piezotolerans WP3]
MEAVVISKSWGLIIKNVLLLLEAVDLSRLLLSRRYDPSYASSLKSCPKSIEFEQKLSSKDQQPQEAD